jgi:hypothetical protein
MFTDAHIGDALVSMVRAIDAPPVPLAAIHRRISRSPVAVRRPMPLLRLALATAAVLVIAFALFPSRSFALIQSMEARYRAALQALGGYAPPAAPKALVAALHVQPTSLTGAQARVHFIIVPPAGLPHDVAATVIATAPTGNYSATTRAWSVGDPSVTFIYRRAGGRTFTLLADRYDASARLTGMYMFEALDPAADGSPRIVRHRQFAWRNGDQIMTAIADSGITAAEIVTIRAAMHGVVLPQRALHAPGSQGSGKLYVAP